MWKKESATYKVKIPPPKQNYTFSPIFFFIVIQIAVSNNGILSYSMLLIRASQ